MTEEQIRAILEEFKAGIISSADALHRLRTLPFEDLGFANVDHHRMLRQGFPEVVFGMGKTVDQVGKIVEAMYKNKHNILVTRTTPAHFERVKQIASEAEFYDNARAIVIHKTTEILGKGTVMVVSAGTSDMAVAEEAVVTLKVMGNEVDSLYIIVVAGMEGALPSVVGGLVSVAVIAVPTSVGYGASFNGVAALLGMLNSCASNVTVVNIDNGYGAAVVASLINRL
ncbi:MAG: 1-(5-phosphoribosyl)-5-amino-4-imidazole-carboxylate carboxylase [Acidobacteria bacterium]|nr:MAG: 1-(5-phosphoribosyl)-5-amino-4-imidazole-carboxylate carboxylase [Acidobacteriota bacterium]